ncbi:MAG: cation transporter [Syntrophomonas sp.]
MHTSVINIIGMSCQHCKAAVENTIKIIPGVYSVEVDLEKGNASVVYDERKTEVEIIKDCIEEIGYRCGQ